MIKLDPVRKYQPADRCIYCDGPGPYSDEHIIAYGLGGNIVLPRASCPQCAKMTGKVERIVLRKMFGAMRIQQGFPTRRPKDRPTHLPVDVIGDDGAVGIKTVPAMLHPGSFFMFRFGPPGILLQLPPSETFQAEGWAYVPGHRNPAYFTRHGSRGHKIGMFHPGIFSQMLAKIAHSFAVADQGLGSFRPMLPDLILGRSKTPSYLVGGDLDVAPPLPVLHRLHLECRWPYAHEQLLTQGGPTVLVVGGAPPRQYLVVHIRLFANWGGPQYHVVVGEWLGPRS